MSGAFPIISNFNAGELSPLIGGRPDLQKFQSGLAVCENFIPRVQGALVRRGGTRFVAEVKDSAAGAWFVPFEYAVNDSFVLEFGDHYIRFFRDRGVQNNAGTPYEIASPYALADLTSAKDGSFALRWEQSGDVLYLAHGAYEPRTLTRFADTDWRFDLYRPDGGPFQDSNEDHDHTVSASGTTGTVTITASAATFLPGHVGALFYMEMADGGSVKPWDVYQEVHADDVRRSDGKYYKCTAIGGYNTDNDPAVTGTEKPIHTQGRYWDGDGLDVKSDEGRGSIGVEWEYQHPGYGWARITGYTSATVVTAEVVSLIPTEAAAGTWRWALPSWSDADGWPDNVTFFRERLTFARDRNLYFSVSGDFANYKAKDFGEQRPDSAFRILLQAGRGDPIEWIAPAGPLLVGTGGSVHTIDKASTTAAFGPTNVQASDQVVSGSSGVQPVLIDAALYLEKSGRVLNELAFSAEANKFATTDLTVFAEHVTAGGVSAMAWAKQPHSVVWCVRRDGALIGFTYMKAQQVSGWHRHPIGGDGVVEHLAVIPSPDGTRDDLWLLVRRTIDGVTRRYVEYMVAEYTDGGFEHVTGYSDAHLYYAGTAVDTVSGLEHLEGCTVQVKARGAAHPDRVVTDGAITLNGRYPSVVVGLAAPARFKLMPLEAGAQVGTAQSRLKRITKTILRLVWSRGGKVGQDFDQMDALEYRQASDPMGLPPPLFTGDKRIEVPGTYDGQATIAVLCDQGSPFLVTAIMPEIHTNEGR